MKCKACNTELKSGYLFSGQSLDWYFDDDSLIKKTLAMGKRISKGAFLSSGKVPASYCSNCDTIVIQDVKIENK